MGRGRARATAIAGLVGTAALLIGGCGESRHDNEQRPQVSTQVSITISPDEVIVQPLKIAMGPEKFQEIPQNQDHPEPPIETDAPLDVIFVTANQTPTDTRLKIDGDKEVKSETVFARSPGKFQVDLPTGTYTISAIGLPEARPARLTVGSYRASSQNDVLTP
ncbi:MAG TPA: hypothetical protein VD741_00595 [Solirubrobacterales bacterium]|nr:hypothetical protein [Solirubrobacterales bacterium]